MKNIIVYGLAILLAMALAPPVGAEEVERRIDAAAKGHVYISNTSGSVTVAGWSRKEVEVTGEIGRNVEELIVAEKGDGIMVKVKVPKHSGSGIASDLYIQVPEGSSIDVGTVSADIEVSNVLGDQKLGSVSGDIDTETVGADIEAEAVSGDVQIRGQGKDADTRASSVSGDVSIARVSGVVEAGSVSGDVIVDEGSFDRASLHTVNGEVQFYAELRDGGKLEAEAVNGEIDLQFKGGISGRFEIDTLNGDIDNCFGPEPKRTSKYTPGLDLTFQEGSGDAKVTASTVNGDIDICR
jgi:DUF4097 and DUF4098 domain-containing protein YvlB